MNILIYIPYIDQSWGGVRQYAIGLLGMIRSDKQNRYYIYHDQGDSEILDAVRAIPDHRLISTAEVSTLFNRIRSFCTRAADKISRRFRLGWKVSACDPVSFYCAANNISVIHCPYQFIPRSSGIARIVTMHDVQEIHFPEFFSADERAFRAVHFKDYIKHSDAVIVSYSHIKNDLIKYFQADADKIFVMLLQMNNLWFDKYAAAELSSLGSYGLPDSFLLYPANTWQHKNHERLIDALLMLKEHGRRVNVVFTGHINGHGQKLKEKVKELGMDEQVRFLGVVDEITLFSLYQKALGVVIPTLYEAGSFPLVESIFLNVPVICSNVTSLPDMIGNRKYTFDPLSVAEIAEKTGLLFEDSAFRDEIRKQLPERKERLIHSGGDIVLQQCYSYLIKKK